MRVFAEGVLDDSLREHAGHASTHVTTVSALANAFYKHDKDLLSLARVKARLWAYQHWAAPWRRAAARRERFVAVTGNITAFAKRARWDTQRASGQPKAATAAAAAAD